ncbi:MAG: MarR family winged helix-turn-helix transcriptional regulator [Anaerovoracaceae bacterium]|nr:MarR family winged helix-turn-helix transcriptional regulator [Anaerovoracaceae bacterium]
MQGRFEKFTSDVGRLYRCIQKIKKMEMEEFDLKGRTVMCLFYLYQQPDGMTVSELSQTADEDMAAVSRAVQDLKDHGMAELETEGRCNKYRARVVLTEKGRKTAHSVNQKAARAVESGGSDLTEDERENFYRAMASITENLEEYTEKMEKDRRH